MPPDARAKKILFGTFWSAKGWIEEDDRVTAPSDLAYAKAKGYMFDPLTIEHDELVGRTAKLVGSLGLGQVSGAFLASLSSRRLDWRSGLVSYLRSVELAPHAFSPTIGCGVPGCDCKTLSLDCAECGGLANYDAGDRNELSYWRYSSGGVNGVRNPMYCLHDLTELARDLPEKPLPEDLAIFDAILATIDEAPANETPTKLSKRLKGVLPSAKGERDTLLEILAVSGVLVAKKSRRGPDTDWFHVENWRGEDGYNRAAVTRLFGMHRKRKPRSR